MKFSQLEKYARKLPIFNKETLRRLEPNKWALDGNIKNWLKSGKIISLKKGLYVVSGTDFLNPRGEFLEYASSQLVKPSYLSFEYILAKYALLSEPVEAITAATVKSTREIKNSFGVFRYYSLPERLFSGYLARGGKNRPVFEAKKEKAMFDYLYLRFLRNRRISAEELEELRLNWESVSRAEFSRVCSYAKLTGNARIKKVLSLIKKTYYA